MTNDGDDEEKPLRYRIPLPPPNEVFRARWKNFVAYLVIYMVTLVGLVLYAWYLSSR